MMPSITSQKLWSRVCVCLGQRQSRGANSITASLSQQIVCVSFTFHTIKAERYLPAVLLDPVSSAKIPFQSRLSRGQSFCFESAKVQLNCVRKHCHTSRMHDGHHRASRKHDS